MAGDAEANIDHLLDRVASGDRSAVSELFTRERDRLRRMIQTRLDARVSQRVDPSDIVQEVLMLAHSKLPQYMKKRPIAFYPWLRQIAWDVLIGVYRKHVGSERRSVTRETACLADESLTHLADLVADSRSGPSDNVMRNESRETVSASLMQLSPVSREVLILRHIELLSVSETAEILGIPEGTVKSRHLRSLKKLRLLLAAYDKGE